MSPLPHKIKALFVI